ncbi:histidine kinase [Paenibacillus luteus]|uniref:hybrid sensor histidine kinase/response regulator n=1 Tax=Paenibacillus luteus TaxID=2545753 RepID=UPI001F4F5171|nr:histidine kinase [Paenibacillus luteus]
MIILKPSKLVKLVNQLKLVKVWKLWKDPFATWLLLITLAGALFIAWQIGQHKEAPAIENGILDLAGWDWEANRIFPLDGEWSFFPNQLLTPEDTKHEAAALPTIPVPGNWDGWHGGSDIKMQGHGYGTYRLLLRNVPTNQTLAIGKPYVRFADKLYVDGQFLGSSGQTGITKQDYEPRNVPYTAYFRPLSSEVEILLQVANYDFRSGGIFESVELGIGKDLELRGQLRAGFELMCVMMLLLFGLLFLFLSFRFDRNPLMLLLSAFSFCFSISVITNGERLFLMLFPDIPFELAFKIKYISVYMGPALLFFISWRLASVTWLRKFLLLSVWILSTYCVAIIFLPFSIYSNFQEALYGYVYLACATLTVMLFYSYLKKRFGSLDTRQFQILLATVWLCLMGSSVVILSNMHLIPPTMTNLTSLLLLLFISFFLAYQYIGVYRSMRKLTDRLQIADRMKDEFLLVTSHELNTPLNGIINMSDSLLAALPTSLRQMEAEEKLYRIRNIAYRMSNMVKDIMDAAQMKEGSLKVVSRTVDLGMSISVVIEVFDFLAKGKNTRFIHQINPEARFVWADENRLLQVLIHVIHHLLKNQSGKIIFIESEWDKECVRVIFRQKAAELLAEEEARQAPWEEDAYEGFEMGMSMAGELLKLMGGQIAIDEVADSVTISLQHADVEQSGWSVPLHIPKKEPPYKPRLKAGDRPGNDAESSIMIASANSVDLEHLYGMLTMEGYQTSGAGENGEVYSRIMTERPDLVIVDALLPNSNGYELCRQIRRRFNHAELPILLISTRNTPADIEAGISAGGSDFITRPFDAGEIRVRIHTLLSMKQLVKDAARSEMAFLRSQIKPHFLYNTLSTIMSLCYTDGPRAGELLSIFSRYLRIIFHQDNTEDTVLLSNEMELINAYVGIERERFGSRLNIEFDVDESLNGIRIIPLTIEPLVENAIRHGVSKKVKGGTVRLSIQQENGLVKVEVADDGVGMAKGQVQAMLGPDSPEQGVGFRNIRRRVEHLTGKSPVVESEPGVGTKVTIWLPISYLNY